MATEVTRKSGVALCCRENFGYTSIQSFLELISRPAKWYWYGEDTKTSSKSGIKHHRTVMPLIEMQNPSMHAIEIV